MLSNIPYGAYFVFGSVNFVMAIVAFWLPETKGVSPSPPPSYTSFLMYPWIWG